MSGNDQANNVIKNCCAFGKIVGTKNVNVFEYGYGSRHTLSLEHSYYLGNIIEENSSVNVDEGAIEITDLEETLDELNTYVRTHKNDYAVPLKEWTIKNGELTFKD